jgi:hypothetical protein
VSSNSLNNNTTGTKAVIFANTTPNNAIINNRHFPATGLGAAPLYSGSAGTITGNGVTATATPTDPPSPVTSYIGKACVT